MDDTIVARNIDGVVTVWSEGLLSNNSIIYKVLSNGVTVVQLLATNGGQVSSGNIGRGDLSRNDVHLENIGCDWSTHGLVGLEGGVGGGEDGEGTSSRDLGSNSSGLKGFVEFTEVLVSLQNSSAVMK